MANVSIDTSDKNAARVDIGDLTVWFSYKTPIAFRLAGQSLVIRQNDWKQTTGKHLNAISPDKSIRISGQEFEAKLAKISITA